MRHIEPYIQYMYSYPHKTAYRSLEGIYLSDYRQYLEQSSENDLYFHVPFCESKCGYCNLFSLTGQKEGLMGEYLEAVKRQAGTYNMKDIAFQSLTIGGGTPLYLSASLLDSLFSIAREYFGLLEQGLRTIVETSPRQTTREKISILKNYDTTRVSIGVQSFQEQELSALHRRHTAREAENALELLKNAGFQCVNLDLIYGIPGQTRKSLRNSADKALFFEPDELFVYPLYVKKGTGLWREGVKASDTAFELYCFIRDYLEEKGYEQVSMRRFVRLSKKPGHGDFKMPEAVGAAKSYKGCGFSENTISMGCGGRSYIGHLHFCTPFSVLPSRCEKILRDYIGTKDYGEIKYGFLLDREELKRRYVIKNLLYAKGIFPDEYEHIFNGSLLEDFPQLSFIIDKGYGYMETEMGQEKAFKLTKYGLALSDYLGPMFISENVERLMKEWNEAD